MNETKTEVEIKVPEIEFLHAEDGLDFHWWHKNKTPYHAHTYYEIVVMESGPVTHFCNGVKYTMQKADAFIMKPKDRHVFMAAPTSSQMNFSVTEVQMRMLCAFISPDFFDTLNENAPNLIHLSETELDYVRLLASQINLHLQSANAQQNNTLIKCIVINLLLAFNRFWLLQSSKVTALPDWLLKFLDVLRSPEVFNKPLEELYRLAPYSQTMLNRYFNQYMGTTLIGHVKKLKMDYAVQLLLHSNYPVSQIASQVSYSTSHFIHEFKNTYGLSPSTYRNLLNKTK